MNLLLDTHALIWFAEADNRLSSKAKDAIELQSNVRFVSIASFWEMAIKASLGKLNLSRPLADIITETEANGFDLLPVTSSHVLCIEKLPYLHRDPFDRVLVCQANTENLVLVSNEALFDSYGVTRLW